MNYKKDELFDIIENSNTTGELSKVTAHVISTNEDFNFCELATLTDLISVRRMEIKLNKELGL